MHFDDPSFADITFEFAGGEAVHAHKLILALSSPTFAAMFGGENRWPCVPCTICLLHAHAVGLQTMLGIVLDT